MKKNIYKMLAVMVLCLGAYPLFAVLPAQQAAIFIKQDLDTAWNNLKVAAKKTGAKFDPSYEKMVLDKLDLLKKSSPELYNEALEEKIKDAGTSEETRTFAPTLAKGIKFVTKEGKSLTPDNEMRIVEDARGKLQKIINNFSSAGVEKTAEELVALRNVIRGLDDKNPDFPNFGNFQIELEKNLQESKLSDAEKTSLLAKFEDIKKQDNTSLFITKDINQYEENFFGEFGVTIESIFSVEELPKQTSDAYKKILETAKALKTYLSYTAKVPSLTGQQYLSDRCYYLDQWIKEAKANQGDTDAEKASREKLKKKLDEATAWVQEYRKNVQPFVTDLVETSSKNINSLSQIEKDTLKKEILPLLRIYILGADEKSGEYADPLTYNKVSLAGLLHRYLGYLELVFFNHLDKNDPVKILFQNVPGRASTEIITLIMDDIAKCMDPKAFLMFEKKDAAVFFKLEDRYKWLSTVGWILPTK